MSLPNTLLRVPSDHAPALRRLFADRTARREWFAVLRADGAAVPRIVWIDPTADRWPRKPEAQKPSHGRQCGHCLKHFDAKSPIARFCSRSCRRAEARARQKTEGVR